MNPALAGREKICQEPLTLFPQRGAAEEMNLKSQPRQVGSELTNTALDC
jgi:hypothetical protein